MGGKTQYGSEPNARLLRRKRRDALRGSPRSFGAKRRRVRMTTAFCSESGSFDCKTASLSRGCFFAKNDEILKPYFFSLLALSQEITSPIVKLVLEPGCL